MSNNFVTFAIEDDPASHLVKRLLRKGQTAFHARLTKPKLEDGAACTGYSQGSIERGSECADPADLPDRREGVVLTHVAVDVQTEAFSQRIEKHLCALRAGRDRDTSGMDLFQISGLGLLKELLFT
jgi:hypothetical protein